jgi:hypothetical protein
VATTRRWDYPVRALVAAGLAIDAYTHAVLAPDYDANKGSAVISQGNLFRVEAAVASLAALVILVVGRKIGYLFALVVSASALGAILLYRYVAVGTLGPLPNMDEPTWAIPHKLTALWAETGVVVILVAVLLVQVIRWSHARRSR